MIDLLERALVLVPKIIPYLSAGVFKSYDFMLATIEGLVRAVYNGNIGGDFVDIMQNLITGQMRKAFESAWEDQGETGFPLPDFLQVALQGTIEQQTDFDFIYGYYQDIVDARVDGMPIEPLLARASMWASRYNEAYNEAVKLINLETGGKLIWEKGQTEKGCETCAALDGIVMFAREWEEVGVSPQGAPNGKLLCGGWNCDCGLRPTTARRTPRGFNSVLNIVSRV